MSISGIVSSTDKKETYYFDHFGVYLVLDRSATPEWLNDPNVDVRNIKYHGDLKKRF